MKKRDDWLLPAMGIALVLVIASGARAGKLPFADTKGPPPSRWRGPWL